MKFNGTIYNHLIESLKGKHLTIIAPNSGAVIVESSEGFVKKSSHSGDVINVSIKIQQHQPILELQFSDNCWVRNVSLNSLLDYEIANREKVIVKSVLEEIVAPYVVGDLHFHFVKKICSVTIPIFLKQVIPEHITFKFNRLPVGVYPIEVNYQRQSDINENWSSDIYDFQLMLTSETELFEEVVSELTISHKSISHQFNLVLSSHP